MLPFAGDLDESDELEVASRTAAKSAAAFRTISEVAEELNIQQHVLRFWETKFPQVRPLKRGGGRRYYRPEDVELLHRIGRLLYQDGYTIKGVQKLLREGVLKPGGRPVAVVPSTETLRLGFAEFEEEELDLDFATLETGDAAPPAAPRRSRPAAVSKMLGNRDLLVELLAELKALKTLLPARK